MPDKVRGTRYDSRQQQRASTAVTAAVVLRTAEHGNADSCCLGCKAPDKILGTRYGDAVAAVVVTQQSVEMLKRLSCVAAVAQGVVC